MIILLILFQLQVDLNNAPAEEIKKLPISTGSIEKILEYRREYGYFRSVYELLKVVSPEEFRKIKYLVVIKKPEEIKDIPYYIERIQQRLASEERPSEVFMDEWQMLAINPMNINKAEIEDVLLLDRVNLVDAISVMRYIRRWGKIRYPSDMRAAPGLTSYGYRNIRDFVITSEPVKPPSAVGYTRLYTSWWSRKDMEDVGMPNIEEKIDYLNAMINDLSADTLTTYERVSASGWSDEEIQELKDRLGSEAGDLDAMKYRRKTYLKTRLLYKNRLDLGLMAMEMPDGSFFPKGFIGVKNVGIVDGLYFGNFHVSLGEGVLFENTDDILSRVYSKAEGLFGDLTTTREFRTQGLGFRLSPSRFRITGFYSRAPKDGIMNRDSTLNLYFTNPLFLRTFRDVFTEEIYGTSFGIDLSNLYHIPFGTYIGLNHMMIYTDKRQRVSPADVEIRYDSEDITDPVYLAPIGGYVKRFEGMYARTGAGNFAVSGEYAVQFNDGVAAGKAYLVKARVQTDNNYIFALFRHYDIGYDNPYARPFMEQKRYDDTPFEKPYRLIDPVYTDVVNLPSPKPEEGLYLETRYRFNRYFTITRAYIDMWKNLSFNLPNKRIQAEIEYRPVFPVRIRLKHKYQAKYRGRATEPTQSVTNETTFRIYALLTDYDYLDFRLRYGWVKLASSETYTQNIVIDGGYTSLSFEHRFSDRFSIYSGAAIWTTNGMSQWIFEDTGIDFLYGDGRKMYVSFIDRVSDNLFVRLKFRVKKEVYQHTGLDLSGGEYHYEGEPASTIPGFNDEKTSYTGNLQIVWWW